MAERVPIMIFASPDFAVNQAFKRSFSLKPEWRATTGIEKRSRKRWMVCGVRPISGTKTKDLSYSVIKNRQTTCK